MFGRDLDFHAQREPGPAGPASDEHAGTSGSAWGILIGTLTPKFKSPDKENL
jgi:hypothetical protein